MMRVLKSKIVRMLAGVAAMGVVAVSGVLIALAVQGSPTLTPTSTPLPKSMLGKLMVDGRRFEFEGGFVPGFYWGQSSQATDVMLLTGAKAAGLSALKVMPPPIVGKTCGTYQENWFQRLDQLLDEAARQNVRILVPFIHGVGMTQTGYDSALYSPYGVETLIKDPSFKACFVDYMRTMARRVNTVNGRTYSTDPTILGWEIIEEPLSNDQNFPIRPPKVTNLEVREWLTEMATDLRTVDPNHPIGVQFTPAGIDETALDDPSRSIVAVSGLDFLEIADADTRVLQTANSNRLYDAAFATGKPVIIFIAFDGLPYADPNEASPNMARMMKACDDLTWQADTLHEMFKAYQRKGAVGYLVYSFGFPGMHTSDDPADTCFQYTSETPNVADSMRQIAAELGPLNSPGAGMIEAVAGR
jgi:hypothetical protein